jgi:hypothetical protein
MVLATFCTPTLSSPPVVEGAPPPLFVAVVPVALVLASVPVEVLVPAVLSVGTTKSPNEVAGTVTVIARGLPKIELSYYINNIKIPTTKFTLCPETALPVPVGP